MDSIPPPALGVDETQPPRVQPRRRISLINLQLRIQSLTSSHAPNMAQPPDIQSILAALGTQFHTSFAWDNSNHRISAAHQPATTTAQAPPVGQPQVPPGVYHYAPPPNNAATAAPPGYGAPPLAHAGNFDLSSIKPVNTGSVSLADALAKAKSFAAERGISDAHRGNPSGGTLLSNLSRSDYSLTC